MSGRWRGCSHSAKPNTPTTTRFRLLSRIGSNRSNVLVTVAMNSFVNNATKVRLVHQGLAGACEPLLPGIPEDANLIDLDRWAEPVRQLLHAAAQAPWVLIPVATKVLHRKRRWLIPMLDSVVLRHYLNSSPPA